MQKDPTKRIGATNTKEIMAHPWFKTINWNDVNDLKSDPPMKPEIKDKFDIENFNKDVIKEKPSLSDLKEIDQNIVNNYSDKFDEF